MDAIQEPILLVEDEPQLRALLELALEPLQRPITAVGDGQAALSRLLSARFALVVTDLQIPLLGGVAMLRRFSAQPQRADTPVLAISARPSLLLTVAGERLADQTLCKPFSVRTFLAEARALLDRPTLPERPRPALH